MFYKPVRHAHVSEDVLQVVHVSGTCITRYAHLQPFYYMPDVFITELCIVQPPNMSGMFNTRYMCLATLLQAPGLFIIAPACFTSPISIGDM